VTVESKENFVFVALESPQVIHMHILCLTHSINLGKRHLLYPEYITIKDRVLGYMLLGDY